MQTFNGVIIALGGLALFSVMLTHQQALFRLMTVIVNTITKTVGLGAPSGQQASGSVYL